MKTIKIILSIAGFAFTSICFGQLLSKNKSDVLFYSAHYNLTSNRMEHQVNLYPARTTSGDYFEASVSSRTYFVPLEFDLAIEEWMTLPFESSVYEEELQIESWMLTPFESNYYEVDPIIEQWMTAPFESGEEIEIEAWMSTIWI
ncbi:MAG: hypothetical protein KAI08_12905 [Bacteroidales bacterium]|nr:hypothetical protein [Bacteroidales bacterium]